MFLYRSDLGKISGLLSEEAVNMFSNGVSDERSQVKRSRSADPTAIFGDIPISFSTSPETKTEFEKSRSVVGAGRSKKSQENAQDEMTISAAIERTSRSLQFLTGTTYPNDFLNPNSDVLSLAAESGCSKSMALDQTMDTFDE